MSAAVVFLLFFICLIIAIPISIALGIVSVLPGAFDPSFTASGTFVIRSMLGGIDSFPLLAVPMFVLSGMIMAKGGISKKIFDVFAFFIGKLTAGMPCAVIVTCLFYGAISGSAPATVAAVGSMTIPILVRLGYDKSFSTAIVAVAGGLGVIIPPSIPFIMYGMASGESVSDLFMAGVVITGFAHTTGITCVFNGAAADEPGELLSVVNSIVLVGGNLGSACAPFLIGGIELVWPVSFAAFPVIGIVLLLIGWMRGRD